MEWTVRMHQRGICETDPPNETHGRQPGHPVVVGASLKCGICLTAVAPAAMVPRVPGRLSRLPIMVIVAVTGILVAPQTRGHQAECHHQKHGLHRSHD